MRGSSIRPAPIMAPVNNYNGKRFNFVNLFVTTYLKDEHHM